MVIITLGILIIWIYLTRSVTTTTVPDVQDRIISEVKPYLNEREISFRVIRKSSLQSPEGEIIRQIPSPGVRIKENRTIDLYVSQGPRYVKVPDVRGKSLLEAKNFLVRSSGKNGRSHLRLGNISRIYTGKQPKEHIILQQPRPQEDAVQGSEIDVLVSKGPWPKRTVVPNVKGKKLNEARAILRDEELTPGRVRHTYRTDSPPSVVLDQFPQSNRIVKRRQSVTLTVNLSEPEHKNERVRYAYIRITPPISVIPKPMRVMMSDQRGKRVVFDRKVKPGKRIQFLASVKGEARLVIYWDGKLHRIRTLEATS